MTKKLYTSKEIYLPYKDMVSLRRSGNLNLGIEPDLAVQMASVKEFGPKTSADTALHLWSWISMGILVYTIYLSYTDTWWFFIIGILAAGIIWKSNKKSHVQNYLDAAMIDEDFYMRVATFGGWSYQIEETEAEKYKNNS